MFFFVYKLMVGSSKISEKIIREKAFEHKKKKPGLSANQPSNNWALGVFFRKEGFFFLEGRILQNCEGLVM